jgi:hypothetical protein
VIDWGQEVPFLAVRPSSVSIRATRYQVRKGTPVVLSGQVESELPAEVVTVYGRKAGAGAFTTLGTARPGAGGRWSLRVKPPLGTTYYKARSKSAASFAIVVRARGTR